LTKFKPGDKVRVISGVYKYTAIGSEAIVIEAISNKKNPLYQEDRENYSKLDFYKITGRELQGTTPRFTLPNRDLELIRKECGGCMDKGYRRIVL
jgi:hypothetical protein